MGSVDVAGCDGLRSVKGGMPDGVPMVQRDAGLFGELSRARRFYWLMPPAWYPNQRGHHAQSSD